MLDPKMDTKKSPSSSEMRDTILVLRKVQHHSPNFKVHYKYEPFMNDILTAQIKIDINQKVLFKLDI